MSALLVAGACSSGTHHSSSSTTARTNASGTRPTSSTATPTTARPVSPTVAFAAEVRALRAHMVDAIALYALQPAGASGTGPSDLAAAANDAGAGAGKGGAPERAALTHAGFVAGYKLLFDRADNREILEFAYRFATAAGARSYGAHALAVRVHGAGAPASLAPGGIPGARIVVESQSDAAAAILVFERGATLVILTTIQPPGTNAGAVLAPIATEQYARLAGY